VFDGVEYVTHGGCRNSGVREVIDLFGLTMTPDHKLLIEGVWLEAKDVLDSGITAAQARCGVACNADAAGEVHRGRRGGERCTTQPVRAQVFDLIDCGPRHRFVIRNSAGDVFISHNSAGHGLNLQRAPRGGHLIWLSATWSSELYEQTVGRIFRPGQRRPVRVTLISAVGTIDEVVLRVLDRKVDAQLLVKAYLAERRAQSGGNSASVDLAAQIKLARQEVSRSHPDHGGTEERFRQAWAKLQMLLGKSV